MRIHRLFFFITFLASVLPAHSQPRRYTLEAAVQTAVASNNELAAARLEVEKADARVREAWGYALPRVDLSARYSRALKKSVFFLPDFNDLGSGRVMPIEIGSDNSFDVNFTASQTLFNSVVIAGVGAASIYSRAAREQYRSSSAATVANVRKAFYGVLVAGEVASMMRSNMANAEENLRNTQILTAQGLVSEYDLLRAEVAVANLRPEVINAEDVHILAMNNLKIAMGIPFSEEIAVDGSLEFQAVPDSIPALAIDLVLDANPSISALRLQADVSRAVVSAQWGEYIPTLSAFGNYQLQGQKNDFKFSTNDFVGSVLVGLTLSVNIFNGLQTNARVEQARLDVRKAEEQISGLEKNLKTLTQSLTQRLQRSRERVAAQVKTVDQAERGYRIATTRFTSGLGTQLEVNDAQHALTRSKVNRIQAIYDYLVASADLDQILGRVPEYVKGEEE